MSIPAPARREARSPSIERYVMTMLSGSSRRTLGSLSCRNVVSLLTKACRSLHTETTVAGLRATREFGGPIFSTCGLLRIRSLGLPKRLSNVAIRSLFPSILSCNIRICRSRSASCNSETSAAIARKAARTSAAEPADNSIGTSRPLFGKIPRRLAVTIAREIDAVTGSNAARLSNWFLKAGSDNLATVCRGVSMGAIAGPLRWARKLLAGARPMVRTARPLKMSVRLNVVRKKTSTAVMITHTAISRLESQSGGITNLNTLPASGAVLGSLNFTNPHVTVSKSVISPYS